MRPKHLSLILIGCISLQQIVYANAFIVTSNADSGPGTLREAITMANANGTSITDSIYFNIADISIAGRRITLLSELPSFSSNIIIDASTQPGSKFGLSDAKIELYVSYSTSSVQKIIRITNCSNIQIYALKITNHIFWIQYADIYCFSIYESTDIKIGDLGKGNIILDFTYAISVESLSAYNKDFLIAGNFLGLDEDGETARYNDYTLVFNRIENLIIGGSDPLMGNHIACSRKRIHIGGGRGNILISNNRIGCNYSGTVGLSLPYGEANHLFDNIFIGAADPGIDSTTEIRVLDNLLTGISRSGVYLMGYTKKFYIQGNKIGTDITGTIPLNDLKMDFGVRIDYGLHGIIGVENNELTEKNIIAFAKRFSTGEIYAAGSAIAINGTSPTISRNSIFCDQYKGISIDVNGPYRPPVVTINNITANTVSGTSPPNARIELFEDDTCVNCEGKLFLGAVYANTNGDWTATNQNTNNIVVTATDTSGQTSEFSMPGYILNNFFIKDATCGLNNGKISGLRIVSGTRWHWEDANGNTVSLDSTLMNVGPGMYRLVIGIGNNNCDITSPLFEIKNVDLPLTLQAPVISNASCGLNNGAIQILDNTTQFKSVWINSSGDSIGTGNFINNLPLGSYYFMLSIPFDSTCKKNYGPFVVNNQFGPFLNSNNISITNATCNNADGSISGIIANNVTGTAFIQWADSLNQIVGTSLDLNNVSGGKYKLKFKDQSTCDTITLFYTILARGAITIDTVGKKISSVSCISNNGSIENIKVTGASSYSWQNTFTGTPVGNSLNVFNLESGNYQLTASNISGCIAISPVINIPNAQFSVTPPFYDDLTILRNTSAVLSVKNFNAGTYSLYKDATATQIVQQNTTGIFSTGSINSDTIFYVQYNIGTCLSSIIPIKIFVVDKSIFAIPKAFTPNNDGLNDKLNVKVIGYIELEYFKIFNRNGEEVFSTKTINDGWNGKFQGIEQPSSVYIWVAKGKDINGKALSQKGTVLLIR